MYSFDEDHENETTIKILALLVVHSVSRYDNITARIVKLNLVNISPTLHYNINAHVTNTYESPKRDGMIDGRSNRVSE